VTFPVAAFFRLSWLLLRPSAVASLAHGRASTRTRLLVAFLLFAPFTAGVRAVPDDLAANPSADRPWQWQSYAAAAGLLHQRVFDVAFARDGTVWLAASNGLWRYDGYRWTVFGPEDRLPSRFVRSVLVTRAGELWVGTDAGVGVFDPEHGRFDHRGTREALPNGNVRRMVEDAEGTLWFCCDQWPDTSIGPGGLAMLRNGRWRVFTQNDGLPMNYVIGYHRDRSGREFAFTPRGWVQRSGERWLAPDAAGLAGQNTVLNLAETAGGRVFAQSEQALLTLDSDGWHPLALKSLLVGDTRAGEVLALTRDDQRGTLRLARWDGADFVPLSAPLPGPRVARFYHLREAPDGAIWCVGEGAILRWTRDGQAWRHFEHLPAPQAVDAADRVWFSGQSGVWWAEGTKLRRLDALTGFIGADRDGLVLGRASDGSLVQIRDALVPAPEPVEIGLDPAQAANDLEHRLWVWGPDAAGHTRFARRDSTGRWITLGSPRLQNQRFISCNPDPAGGLDVVFLDARTTDYAVAHVDGDAISWIDLGAAPPPIPYPQFYRVGAVEFISGYDRIYRRDTGAGGDWSQVTELSAGAFTQPLVSPGEVLVLFNGGKAGAPGCASFRNGRWAMAAGEFDHGCFSPDRRRLSIATRGGVFRRSAPGALDFDYLPLPEDVLIQSLFSTTDGALWAGTSDGVLHYQPRPNPPETEIHAQVTEVGGGLPVRFGGVARHQVSVPPQAWRYSWRFDDLPWSRFVSGEEFTLPTTSLSPGPHRLELRARSAEGVDPSPARLDFEVRPVPLQERPWFPPALTGVALLIAGLLWLGVARTRAIRRSNAALRREIAEREQAEAALRAVRDDLEKRVAERTAELSSSNQSLRRALDEQAAADLQRARLEEQLREAQKMQAIGTLAGGIAHDFNNILTIIIPCAQFAHDEPDLTPATQKYLRLVLQAANRAKLLVEQILAFSRRQPRVFDLVDLASLVRETETLVASTLPAGVTLRSSITPGLPPVLADSTQLHQVLMNLCTNAEHALRGRPEGRIHVGLDLLKVDADASRRDPALHERPYVRLSIEDNGVGMPEDVRQRIFEPFFTTKVPGHGTGLGLAVVHGIVQEHGGVIRVESRLGRGTRVEVLLPAQTASAPAAKAPVRPLPRGNGETILLVDDIPEVLESIGGLLRHAGYTVVGFHQASAALAAFVENPGRFDVLVTDLSMHGMGGLELCRRIRRERGDIPVLAITGFDGTVSPDELVAAGVDALVIKPIDNALFFQRLHELLRVPIKPGGAC
jgi:signal transduction histidine kinase/CheY-like chemotaxis protein/streptogramin lyase